MNLCIAQMAPGSERFHVPEFEKCVKRYESENKDLFDSCARLKYEKKDCLDS